MTTMPMQPPRNALRHLAALALGLLVAAPVFAQAVAYPAPSRPLPAQAPSGEALYADYLENPRNTGEGQAAPHVLLLPYADAEAALRERSDWTLPLDGRWKLRMADLPEHVPAGFWRADYDVSAWQDVRVPHTLQSDGLDHAMFRNEVEELFPDNPPHVPRDVNPTASYVREFELPADWNTRSVLLRFEGATSAYFVWVNGRYVGYDQGGYTPAEFDIGAALQPGRNRIAVQLQRWSAGSYLEDYDQWRYSGIFRSVWLYAVPKARIRDAWIDTDLDAQYRDASLRVRAFLAREGDASAGRYRVRAVLHDARGREVARGESPAELAAQSDAAGNAGQASLALALRNPAKWSDETPNLYTLVLSLLDPTGRSVHVTRQDVGLREIDIRDRVLRVNGRRILVKGVNRAETDPDHGRHVPREHQLRDVRLMKQLHLNAVRTSHYPSDPYFYDLANRHGLWIADEMEVETHAHEHCPDRCLAEKPEWQTAFLERFAAMVARDRNHPSVLLWDTGNEAGLGKAHYAMAEWAKAHEPTRPLYHQSNQPDGDAPFAHVWGARYPSLKRLGEIANETKKPVILGEYAHAMGNSLGNFGELWELIRAHPHMQGGFVWDWAAQNLRQPLRYAPDTSGNGIAAWLVGAPETVPGAQGQALRFSGLDDFVELYRDPKLDLDGSAITLDARVRVARPFTDFTLISKGDAQYALRMKDADTLLFALGLDGKTVTLEAPAPASLYQRYTRLSATYDGRAMRLYADGRLLAERQASGRISQSYYPVNIGRDPVRMNDQYRGRTAHGDIDQVRIHGVALDARTLAQAAEPRQPALLALDFDALVERGSFLSYGVSLSGVDGLVGPDRELQPETAQLAWVSQPLRMRLQVDGRRATLALHNEQAFAAIDGARLRCRVVQGGQVLAQAEDPLRIDAGASRTLDIALPDNPQDMERFLDVEVSSTRTLDLQPAGWLLARDQFALGGHRVAGAQPPQAASAVTLDDTAAALHVRGTEFEYRFDKASGALASMRVRGRELLHADGGPRLDAWRAPISNEIYAWGGSEGMAWRQAGLDRLQARLQSFSARRIDAGNVEVTARSRVAAADVADAWFEQELRYRIDAAGSVAIHHAVSPQGRLRQLPYLPRIGLALRVPAAFDRFGWHGRRVESYVDRREGSPIGVWSARVDQLGHDYFTPQDNGNRTDVRWASLGDGQAGLLVSGAGDVAVSRIDASDRAGYAFALRPNAGWLTLHASHLLSGVGDTPNPVLPQYRAAADRDYAYDIVLRPLSAAEARSGLPAGTEASTP